MIDRQKQQTPGSDRWGSSRQDEQSENEAHCPKEGGPKEGRDGRLIEWFGKWRKPIRSWLRNRASVPPGDIDDLAQEVFIQAWRLGSSWRGTGRRRRPSRAHVGQGGV